MPAYNAHEYIRLAIRSTLATLPSDSELLILVEGKNRELYDFESFNDSRLRIFWGSEKPLGIANALNQLLSNASGEFIARMDADDIALPGRFTRGISALLKYDADFAFSNCIHLFKWRGLPLLFPQPCIRLQSNQITDLMVLANPFVHGSMTVRLSTINSLGGYSNTSSEDFDLWLRARMSGKKFVRVASYGLLYRNHPLQTSLLEKRAKPIKILPVDEQRLKYRLWYAALNKIKQGDVDQYASRRLSSSNLYFKIWFFVRKNLNSKSFHKPVH